MKKTLGGDRLSSGKRMTVNLKAYERSTHNKGYIWKSTASPGTIIPFMVQVATPGSTLDIELDSEIFTKPTNGPLFDNFKLDYHIFQAPVRLYQGALHNNKLNIGLNMSQVKLPLIELTAQPSGALVEDPNFDLNNSQINPSCLLAYLGIRGIGFTAEASQVREFNAIPLLAYWDIVKNYYTNKQEEIGAFIKGNNLAVTETVDAIEIGGNVVSQAPATTSGMTPNYGDSVEIQYTGASPDPTQIFVNIAGALGFTTRTLAQLSSDLVDQGGGVYSGTWTFSNGGIVVLNWRYETAADTPIQAPSVATFSLTNIDEMREAILSQAGASVPFIVNDYAPGIGDPYLALLTVEENGRNPRLNTQEGLAVKTYQSDIFNNWLNSQWIDDINSASAITVSGGGTFTLDQLLFGRKMFDYLNRIGVSGGTYKDWIEASYTEIGWNKVESPVYWGGLIKELTFQQVVSNSATSGDQTAPQPLGSLAGRGVMAKKHKGGKIVVKCDEHSYVIGLFSITPRITYSQGNSWDCQLKTMEDFHKPAFDGIGFQELPIEQMAWWDTNWTGAEWDTRSAGKQTAWIHYMTEVNKSYGNFAIENSEMFMTLNRRYEGQLNTTMDVVDVTTYIDPVKYNYIFADTSIDAQNFWVQIAVDLTYRAKMSARQIPNL